MENFKLFITTKIVAIIVSFTNERTSQLPKESLESRVLLKSWYPVTVEEIFAYTGIRVYYGTPCRNMCEGLLGTGNQ
jgi:hypothetical protein